MYKRNAQTQRHDSSVLFVSRQTFGSIRIGRTPKWETITGFPSPSLSLHLVCVWVWKFTKQRTVEWASFHGLLLLTTLSQRTSERPRFHRFSLLSSHKVSDILFVPIHSVWFVSQLSMKLLGRAQKTRSKVSVLSAPFPLFVLPPGFLSYFCLSHSRVFENLHGIQKTRTLILSFFKEANGYKNILFKFE